MSEANETGDKDFGSHHCSSSDIRGDSVVEHLLDACKKAEEMLGRIAIMEVDGQVGRLVDKLRAAIRFAEDASKEIIDSSSSRFTGDDAHEDGERLTAAIEVALEEEAEKLRKKIIKVEQLGYACPRSEIVEARRRLAEIDEMLSR